MELHPVFVMSWDLSEDISCLWHDHIFSCWGIFVNVCVRWLGSNMIIDVSESIYDNCFGLIPEQVSNT